MINNIGILNFKASYKLPKLNREKNNNFYVSTSTLAPLTKDTISFGHALEKKPTLEKEVYDSIASPIYDEVSKNATPAMRDLKGTLNGSLRSLVYSKKTNLNSPIKAIVFRVKSGNSIREKIASSLSDQIKSKKTEEFDLLSGDVIKEKIQDIVGARIILRKSEPKDTSKIIDALIKEVENGKLKVVEIVSYEPINPDNSHFRYVTKKDISRFENAVNKKRQESGLQPIRTKYAKRDSGYIACHMKLDLSNCEKYKAKKINDGYFGEIQILGEDVEKLKELEDFCYKLHLGKLIKGGHPAYKQFVDYYKKHMLEGREIYPNLFDDILEYTAKAYSLQRKKEPDSRGFSNKYAKLPTIAQCGMQGKIPPELDFNNLAKIKKACDALYESTLTGKTE